MARIIFAFILLVSMGCAAEQEQHTSDEETRIAEKDNRLTDEEVDEGWMLLFDGQTVGQWRGYNQDSFPEKGWKAENGLLIVEKSDGSEEGASGGGIITRAQYRDFAFSFDFMLTDSANSGVLYLVQEVEDTPIWHNAPEYQILDDPTYTEMLGADWMPTHRTGENYDLHAADDRPLHPVGKWNTGMIRKSGNHVQHWLNGELLIDYRLGSPEWDSLVARSKFAEYPQYGKAEMGHIALQDHGHEVRFKNLKIRTQ